MKERLEAILGTALDAVAQAETTDALEDVRVRFLGRKGELTALLRQMGQLAPELRPAFGEALNRARDRVQAELEARQAALLAREKQERLRRETIDVTMPGGHPCWGRRTRSPSAYARCADLVNMGFKVIEGPEVETEFYNFTALNTAYHPARDVQDTFYISDSVLLRTQTSPMQVREMERSKPPVKVVVPGKVPATTRSTPLTRRSSIR